MEVLEIERSIIKKYRKDIWAKFVKAINEFEMIKENDKIAVCISGGKDSMLMAKCFQELKRHGKFSFDLEFLVMDPGYNKLNRKKIEDNAKKLGIPITIFETEIFNIVDNIEDSPCYLCARMRRGNLYSKAKELGCNKIALGHHFDDVIETILMSMLYGGEVKTMMPKLHSTNFEGLELIRPMYFIKEKKIISWAKNNELSFLNCACKFTEQNSKKENESKRKEIKELIENLEKVSSYIPMNIFKSVYNINLNTIIGYHKDDMKYNFLAGTLDENLGNFIEKLQTLTNSFWKYIVIALAAVIVVWGAYVGIKIAIAHRNEEKINARGMLKSLLIGVIVIFVIAVGAPLLINGLSAWTNSAYAETLFI